MICRLISSNVLQLLATRIWYGYLPYVSSKANLLKQLKNAILPFIAISFFSYQSMDNNPGFGQFSFPYFISALVV
jgi:hypothetical protein